MEARANEMTMESYALFGRGVLLSVVPITKTVTPNLAEICLKGRKTRRFRSSWGGDRHSLICGFKH